MALALLGGWWRLWLALSGLYGAAVIAVAVAAWPDVPQVSHHPSLYYRMSETAQTVMNRAGLPTREELERGLIEADRSGDASRARYFALEIRDRQSKGRWQDAPIILEMPNKHQILVAGSTSKSESELVGREYARVLQDEVESLRWRAVLYFALVWLGPVAAVCALGLLTSWVVAGFRGRAR